MDCPICYELTNDFITTNCNHIFCINCITKIKWCAMCRTELTRSKLCKEIRQKYLQTNINENINVNTDPINVPLDFWFSGNPGLAIPFVNEDDYTNNFYTDLSNNQISFTQEYIENLVGDA